jgi:ribose transport system substrate-binding protein
MFAGCGGPSQTMSPVGTSTFPDTTSSSLSGSTASGNQRGGIGGSAAGGVHSTVTYGIVPNSLDKSVLKIAEYGADLAAKNLEKDNPGATYNVIFQSPSDGGGGQAKAIDALVSEHVNGISLAAIDSAAVKTSIADATGKGIPVICFESDAPDSARTTLYAVDGEAVGKQLADELVSAIGGTANMKGRIGVVAGLASDPNQQARAKGVAEVLNAQSYPDISVLPTLYRDPDDAKSADEIRSTMRAHPKIRGWVFLDAWPLSTNHGLDGIDPKVTPIVAMDSLPGEWRYLKSGQVYCLVGRKYVDWGEQSVKILDAIRTGATKNPPAFIDSGYDLIFANPTPAQHALAHDNIAVYSEKDYEKMWKAWSTRS